MSPPLGRFRHLRWLAVQIFSLIGFRNRVLVILQWAWAYLTYRRAEATDGKPQAAQ